MLTRTIKAPVLQCFLFRLCLQAAFLLTGLIPIFGAAQTEIMVVNAPNRNIARELGLETEFITINRFSGVPNEIRRHAGKFVLVLVNRTLETEPSFVVEPFSGVADTGPLLRVGGKAFSTGMAAGVIDAHPGQYVIRSVASGRTLCRITIQE